jgi:hypothetical protein
MGWQGGHYSTSRKVEGSSPDEVSGFFSLPNPSSSTIAVGSIQPRTRNLPGGKGRSARNADNLTSICEPIVYKMWDPRRLTTLWASTACYRDSFTFYYLDVSLGLTTGINKASVTSVVYY